VKGPQKDVDKIRDLKTIHYAGTADLFTRVGRLEERIWRFNLATFAVVVAFLGVAGYFLYYISQDIGNIKARIQNLEDFRNPYGEFKKDTNQRLDNLDQLRKNPSK
jgi:predicted PurR-regulated permease PerM